MRPALILGILVAATTAVAGAAVGPAKKIDRDSASGASAAIFVSGEVLQPRQFIIRMKSSPTGQPVEGSVSISCRDKAYNFTDRTRPLARVMPAKIRVPPTKRRAAYCAVGVSADVTFSEDGSATGRLTATLLVKQKR